MSLLAGQSASQVLGVTGLIVSIGGLTGASGTEVWTVIGEVKDGKRSGSKRATTMSTNFSSLGVAQKLGTILDLGTFTFTTNRVGNDAGQTAVIAAHVAGGAWDIKVQLPMNPLISQVVAGDVITMSGIVTEAGAFDISLDKVSEYTFTVDLNSYVRVVGS